VKMFDADKTRMIGLPYGKKNYHNMLSRFYLIPERYGQTDGRTDRQTKMLYQYRASVCCRAIKTAANSKASAALYCTSLRLMFKGFLGRYRTPCDASVYYKLCIVPSCRRHRLDPPLKMVNIIRDNSQ